MYTQSSSKKRLTALLVAFAFLLGTFAVGTETVSAASKLKVSPTHKTVYVGSKVTIKANKKVLHFFLGDFNKRTNLHRSATA